MFHRKTVFLVWVLLITFCVPSFSTEIYTWVDEKKVTHFSQFPPTGQNANKIPLRYQPAKSTIEAKAQVESLRKELENTSQPDNTTPIENTVDEISTSKEKEKRALIRLRCEKAKQELAFLQSKSTPEVTGATGDTRLLTQTEKKQRLQAATSEMGTYCY